MSALTHPLKMLLSRNDDKVTSTPGTYIKDATAQAQATEPLDKGHLVQPNEMASESHGVKAIMQRFLQDFEYVELDYPISGEASKPEEGLSYHPHIHFRMCGDERKAMQPDQVQVHLARHIDRGLFLMRNMGLEVEDFYVNAEKGELRYDAHVPNPPEGKTEREVLEDLTAKLQEACTQARKAVGREI